MFDFVCLLSVTSVTLILRDFEGVAHSNGVAGSDNDKEIHFSTRHIKGLSLYFPFH